MKDWNKFDPETVLVEYPVLVADINSTHFPAVARYYKTQKYLKKIFGDGRWYSFHPHHPLWFTPTHWRHLDHPSDTD